MRRGSRIGLPMMAVLLLMSAGVAQADPIVLEVYIGARPADADRFVAPVLDELQRHRHLAGPEAVGAGLEIKLGSRPAEAEDAVIDRFVADATVGYQAWLEGRFEESIGPLTRAVEITRKAPLAIAERAELRTRLRDALVSLALARLRRGDDEDARGTMAEVVRSFRDAPIEKRDYGPEAYKLFAAVRKAIEQDRGALSVRVDDDQVMIFVNETYVGFGQAQIRDLPAGRYRIMVRKSAVARMHEIMVEPGAEAQLDVEWALDAALHTSPSWTGMVFPDQATRDRDLPALAVRLGLVLDARAIIVVTLGPKQGRRAITGWVYSVDSIKDAQDASIPLEPVEPSETRLRALGAFLAGDPNAPRPSFEVIDEDPSPRSSGAPRGGWTRLLSWMAIGAGAAAVIAGGVLVALDEDSPALNPDGPEPKVYWDSAKGGTALLIGGAVAIGGGVLLRVLGGGGDHERRQVVIDIGPGGGYVGWMLRY